MQIISFKSLPRATPFAPEYHYVLGEDFIDGIDYDKIAKVILSKENEVIV